MQREFDLEAFDEQPIFFETEAEGEIPRKRRTVRRGSPYGNRLASLRRAALKRDALKRAAVRKRLMRQRALQGFKLTPRFPFRYPTRPRGLIPPLTTFPVTPGYPERPVGGSGSFGTAPQPLIEQAPDSGDFDPDVPLHEPTATNGADGIEGDADGPLPSTSEEREFTPEHHDMFEFEDEIPFMSGAALGGSWLRKLQSGQGTSLAAIAERIAAKRSIRPPVMELEHGKKAPSWTSCFSTADIDRVRKTYQDNATAARANRVDRCSCIVMLNVALGELLKLKTKEARARGTSARKVKMGALTTETIEKAMAQLQRAGFARPVITINFFDNRNKTAGTLKPERLKASVQKAVLDRSPNSRCWYAYGLSILDGYHSVLLLVDKTAPSPKIYWLDQFSPDINDDVTTVLDQRITTKTQDWWQAVKTTKNVGYNTMVRIWPLRRLTSP